MERIILASESPRRRELLALYGIPFEVIPSHLGEFFAEGSGQDRVVDLARKKAFVVGRKHPGRYVLAADTLVCVDQHILGKPKDELDAVRMLKMLSGRAHYVYTGVCLRLPDKTEIYDAEVTRVAFLNLPENTIRRYVSTGEPMDKAGAYGLQGIAGMFISRIEGSPSNVIGLPLALLTQIFWQAGLDIPMKMPEDGPREVPEPPPPTSSKGRVLKASEAPPNPKYVDVNKRCPMPRPAKPKAKSETDVDE